jgi:uncharacterized membrane protein YbhN (UPF0104 family)
MDYAGNQAHSRADLRPPEVLTVSTDSASANDFNAVLNRRLRQAVLVMAAVMLIYLGVGMATDAPAFAEGLQRLYLWQWLTLLSLSMVNYSLRFLRWQEYLVVLGARLPMLRHLGIYIAGFAFTVTPGKAGEAVRSVYLRGTGVPWSRGLAALAVERILDLTAVVMLAAMATQAFADYAAPAVTAVLLVAALLYVITRPGLVHWLMRVLPAAGRISGLVKGSLTILDDARALLAPGRLFPGLLLGVLAWGAEAWGFYLLLQWLGIGIELPVAMGIYAMGMLAGAISFLPGGLGGAEAAMVALLLANGVVLGTAVLATVICRAVTLWFAVLLGIIAMLILEQRDKS